MYIYIRAMSEAQAEVYRRVSDQAVRIVEHVIKLLEYPNAQEYNHWKQEIQAFLNEVPKLRGSNKFPKSKLIYKGLTRSNDVIDKLIGRAHRKYKDKTPLFLDNDVILAAVEEYQHWLSEMLSREGIIDSDDIYTELDYIVNKYSRK